MKKVKIHKCPGCGKWCRIIGKTTLHYERIKSSKKKCVVCVNRGQR